MGVRTGRGDRLHTSGIEAVSAGHRVQLPVVVEGLFSGGAVSESGGAVHRLLQLGCERFG